MGKYLPSHALCCNAKLCDYITSKGCLIFNIYEQNAMGYEKCAGVQRSALDCKTICWR